MTLHTTETNWLEPTSTSSSHLKTAFPETPCSSCRHIQHDCFVTFRICFVIWNHYRDVYNHGQRWLFTMSISVKSHLRVSLFMLTVLLSDKCGFTVNWSGVLFCFLWCQWLLLPVNDKTRGWRKCRQVADTLSLSSKHPVDPLPTYFWLSRFPVPRSTSQEHHRVSPNLLNPN